MQLTKQPISTPLNVINLKKMEIKGVKFESVGVCEKKCGEMFLAMSGDISFFCTLCDCKYPCFQDYADHLMTEHYNCSTFEEYCVSTANEDFNDKFIEEEDSFSECSHENTDNDALKENELSIEMLKQENSLNIFSKQFEHKESETAFYESDERSDATSQASNETKRNVNKNHNKIKKSTRRNVSKLPEKRCFKCTECDYSCRDKSNLISHIKRHSNRKPYQCNECHKEFYTRTELKSHYRRHTGERPFLCTDCGLTFFTSGILTAHLKRHNNIRDKECSICHKRFFDGATLVSHMRIHTGERPFKCKVCSSSFKRRNALASHLKMHENKREHQCEFCPARFNQKCNLNAHRKSKHLLAIAANVEHGDKISIVDNGSNL